MMICTLHTSYVYDIIGELYLNWLQFRAARKASEEVGAQIVLGDRPIEITVCTNLDPSNVMVDAIYSIA